MWITPRGWIVRDRRNTEYSEVDLRSGPPHTLLPPPPRGGSRVWATLSASRLLVSSLPQSRTTPRSETARNRLGSSWIGPKGSVWPACYCSISDGSGVSVLRAVFCTLLVFASTRPRALTHESGPLSSCFVSLWKRERERERERERKRGARLDVSVASRAARSIRLIADDPRRECAAFRTSAGAAWPSRDAVLLLLFATCATSMAYLRSLLWARVGAWR